MAKNPERINRINYNSKEVSNKDITLLDGLYQKDWTPNTQQLSQVWSALNNKDISPFLQNNTNIT